MPNGKLQMLGFADWLQSRKNVVTDSPSQSETEKESRPYTRSLRYYPTISPPTGGGPNFAFIGQDALASANAGLKTVPSPPSPGMEDHKIRKREKAWKKSRPSRD